MTVKDLKKALEGAPDSAKIVVVNEMGHPAYDYEDQRFECRFDKDRNVIAMTKEVP